MTSIKKNITHIMQTIRELELKYGRHPHSVQVIAASKKHSAAEIKQAITARQFAFGENYLQEATEKMALVNNPLCEWHFIGSVQRNKTKQIAELFTWVQSLESMLIAERLNAQRPSALPPLNVCIQVNTSQEDTKSGIHFDEVLPLARACIALPRLRLRGLMTIPAPKKHFIEQRAECYKLKLLYQELQAEGFELDTLSMGMTNDMEAAIAEGATLLRIGTGFFGGRV